MKFISEFKIVKFLKFGNFQSDNPKNKNEKHLSICDNYPLYVVGRSLLTSLG